MAHSFTELDKAVAHVIRWLVFCDCGFQYSCFENPMNSMKRQKDRTLKDELPRSVGAQYAPGDQWRDNTRKNERTEPKQKQHPVVDVTGDRSKVQCCKEQYRIGTWNVRSIIKANWKWSNRRWQE